MVVSRAQRSASSFRGGAVSPAGGPSYFSGSRGCCSAIAISVPSVPRVIRAFALHVREELRARWRNGSRPVALLERAGHPGQERLDDDQEQQRRGGREGV